MDRRRFLQALGILGTTTYFDVGGWASSLVQRPGLGVSVRMIREYHIEPGIPQRLDVMYGWSPVDLAKSVKMLTEKIDEDGLAAMRKEFGL